MEERLLRIQQGSTWGLDVQLTDDQGQPLDLTGATAKMQLRRYPSSPDVLLELSTENQRIQIGTDGTLLLIIPAAVTAALAARPGCYDLAVTLPPNPAEIVLGGDYLILPGVTR
jgi:hypothetical protein